MLSYDVDALDENAAARLLCDHCIHVFLFFVFMYFNFFGRPYLFSTRSFPPSRLFTVYVSGAVFTGKRQSFTPATDGPRPMAIFELLDYIVNEVCCIITRSIFVKIFALLVCKGSRLEFVVMEHHNVRRFW